jgi:hypothetical protein
MAEDAHSRIVTVRDAIRAVAELVHDGRQAGWCDEVPVSRGDLAALIGILGDQLEAAVDQVPMRVGPMVL